MKRKEPTKKFVNLVNNHVEKLEQDTEGLEWSLVGGAIRDHLMGRESHDFDFVVEDTSHEDMVERGFEHVDNKAFPVYLSSEGSEFAITRKEKSTGQGYNDFEVKTGVDLKTDLTRRALTMNAIAMRPDGTIVDVWEGRRDMEDGVVRVIKCDTLKKDPVRCLRVARFATKFGFDVPDRLIRNMSYTKGHFNSLPNERIIEELIKVFKTNNKDEDWRYFDTLREAGLLRFTYPFVSAMQGVVAGPYDYHEEQSLYHHTSWVVHHLDDADWKTHMMALVHDCGKLRTPVDELPHHYSHTKLGLDVVDELQERYNLSNELTTVLKVGVKHHHRVDKIPEMSISKIITMFDNISNKNLFRLLDLVKADKKGRFPSQELNVNKLLPHLLAASRSLNEVKGQDLIERGFDPEEYDGKEFGNILHQHRVEKARKLVDNQNTYK